LLILEAVSVQSGTTTTTAAHVGRRQILVGGRV
jgi:hypothetical protein